MKPVITTIGICRVLSIFPSSKGFGFAVFEDARLPVDWGAVRVGRKKNKESLKKIKQLIKLYKPEKILLREESNKKSHGKRIHTLLQSIESLARENAIPVIYYSRSKIRSYFKQFNAVNKDEIARAIVQMMPEFKLRLPGFRKAWMSEDYRINIFDAISMVLAFYHFEGTKFG